MSNKSGTNATKDVIYIDVDDEITGIIDKVRASEKKIVALVLPKRAAVLQSIVNMKLLKRSTDESKKKLVLITSEAGLLPLAGSVGVHVAKSLNSRPEVPDAPARASASAEAVEDATDDTPDPDLDTRKTVGELAGAGAPDTDTDDESIELDNDDQEDQQEAKDGKPGKSKGKKDRKFKIPDFNKFRLMLALAIVGVLALGSVGYAAVAVWPQATITIQTDSQAVNSSAVLALKSGDDVELDAENGVVQGVLQEVKKTLSEEVPATGQKNNGKKASGSVEMTAKDCDSPIETPPDVPSGSGVSSGGKTYITQKRASFEVDDISGGCVNFKSGSIKTVAQSGGSDYNVSSTTFDVSGRSDVTAQGSASGGTDDIVKIVTQGDIDGAKKKITDQDTDLIEQELKSALIGRDLFAVEVTFSVGEPKTELSVEANSPADTVKVTQTITYTMFGAKHEDIEKIIEKDVEEKIDTDKQSIVDYGLEEAFFSLQGLNDDGATVAVQTTIVAGAELDEEAIKKEVAGQKAGDAKEIISAHPGVTEVDVEYSPFWVRSVPSKTDKITVIIQEPKVIPDDTEQSP